MEISGGGRGSLAKVPSVGWWGGGGNGYFLKLHIEKKFVQIDRIETCPVEQLGPGC